MKEDMQNDYAKEEVRNFIFQMKGNVTMGFDGLPTLFYHHYWDTVGPKVTHMTLNILNNKYDS